MVHPHLSTRSKLLIALTATIALAGCPSQKAIQTVETEPTSIEIFNTEELATQLNAAINDSDRLTLLLERVDELTEFEPEFLQEALNRIRPVLLSRNDKQLYHYLMAVSYHSLGDNQLALENLDELTTRWINQQSREAQSNIHRFSSRILESVNLYGRSAISRYSNCVIDPDEQCDDDILRLLTETNVSTLSSLHTQDSNWQRWLELSQLLTDMSLPMTMQGEAIADWLATNEDVFFFSTPAAIELLIEVSQLPQPRTAVLIPLSGRFEVYGKAIRDGYIAGYFHETSGSSNRASIDFYDSNVEELQALYQDLTSRYDLIIGPLEKSKVSTIAQIESSTPTLLLNTQDQNPNREGLFYFGLDLRHEASEAAEQVFARGLKRPLLALPNGSTNDEFFEHFSETWASLTEDNDKYYQPARLSLTVTSQYSSEISASFGITASNDRARQIARTLGAPVEAEPRRRNDIDSLIISATADEARQLNPLIKYHHGEDLSVFATSRAFPGLDESEINKDLEGIFVELPPWVIYDTHAASAIRNYGNNDPILQNLFALGYDGFSIGTRLNYLSVVPSARASGETGQLSINESNNVVRRLFWGKFQNQQIRAIEQ